jgi:hypothetical protein
VVGSQARIFMPMRSRVKIAEAFNQAIAKKELSFLDGIITMYPEQTLLRETSISTTDRVLQPIWQYKT